MDNVRKLLKENSIKLVMLELEKKGYYHPEIKTMFVDVKLNEDAQKEVILHELGHALKHRDYSILYKSPSFRTKMENEATYYMVDHLIKESDGQFNYSDLFHRYKLGLGWEDKIK